MFKKHTEIFCVGIRRKDFVLQKWREKDSRGRGRVRGGVLVPGTGMAATSLTWCSKITSVATGTPTF
jgi:hypothetical protein